MNTDNRYLNQLAYEVQVVLDCDADNAGKIIAAALTVGQDPVKLVQRLPAREDGMKHDPTEVLAALEDARKASGAQKATVCFPAGYKNRKARRDAKRKAKNG